MTAARNAFGTEARTMGSEEVALLAAGPQAAVAELDRLTALARADAAAAAASGRWVLGRPDPPTHVPGDVVALRAFAVTSDLVQAARLLEGLSARAVPGGRSGARLAASRLVASIAEAAALYRAVPHFIDTPAAAGILASQPPGPDVVGELRLPYPHIAVFLGQPLEVPADLHDWPEEWDAHVDTAGRLTGVRTTLGNLRAQGGGIDGVMLSEAPNGGLAQEVLWLLSSNPDPTRPAPMCFDRMRGLVWGRLSLAELAPVATNLAAAVAWAEWRPPERRLTLPAEVGSKAWRRATRRGEFRRHEPRGALAGVHVLDLVRSPLSERRRGVDSGRAVATHLRRAHWRLQPVGPGRSQRRVVRVAATVVNPGRRPGADVVYRVPRPDGAPEGSARAEPQATEPPSARPATAEPVIDLRTVELPHPPVGPVGAPRSSAQHESAQPEVTP